jgi:hypothetical protein
MKEGIHIWTDEMIKRFRQLHRDPADFSFEVMAAAMSKAFDIKLTRNALIGKARRLGLPMRGQQKLARLPIEKKIRLRARPVDAPIEPVVEPPPATPQRGVTIYQLNGRTCRWPLGAVEDWPPYLYCGADAPPDCPYCPEHSGRAFSHPRAA